MKVAPFNIPILPPELLTKFISVICLALFPLLVGYVFNCFTKMKWNVSHVLNIVLPALSIGLLYDVYGISMNSIKGMLFTLLLIYAGISDLTTRQVSNWVHFCIAIVGLIDKQISDIPFMVISSVIITLPQLFFAVIKQNSYGGADIKLTAACTFLLGLKGGLIALIIGLSLGISLTVIKRKFKKESLKEKFPIVPYLAVGSFISFLLI